MTEQMNGTDALAAAARTGAILDRQREERRAAAELKFKQADQAWLVARMELDDQRQPGEDDGDEPGEDTPAAGLFNFRSLADFLAESDPPIEWLVEPYLEVGCFAGLVAPPNLGKTLLSYWAATTVARAGHRVDVIQMEGGKRGFKQRIRRAVQAVGGIAACSTIQASYKPRFSLLDPAAVERLCIESKGAKLIVIDSLACATAGIDENSSKEMGQIVRSLQIIQHETGAAVLIIHHTGKTKWRPGGDAPSIGDGRGSGVLDAALDTVLALAPLPENEQQPGFVSFGLYNTKQRDAEKAAPQIVRIAMLGLEATVTMQPLSEAREQMAVNTLALDVLRVVRGAGEEGCSKAFVEANVKGGNAKKIAALMELKACGEVEEVPFGQYSRWVVSRHSPSLPNLPKLRSGDPSPTSPPYVVGGEWGSRPRGPHGNGELDVAHRE